MKLKENYKILTFLWHTGLSIQFATTGYEFYCWPIPGQKPRTWPYNERPKPPNIHLCQTPKILDYDFALVFSRTAAEFVKSYYPNIPVLYHISSKVDNYILEQSRIADILIAACWRNFEGVKQNNKYVIYPCFDIKSYGEYMGNIAYLITICNQMEKRTEILDKPFSDVVVEGLPHSYIGDENETLDNGISVLPHEVIKEFLVSFRAFVITPQIVSGMTLSIGEALMTGMPVIIKDYADWGQFIKNGQSGFISKDAYELHEIAKRLLKDRALAIKIGAAGREAIKGPMSVASHLTAWRRLIKTL